MAVVVADRDAARAVRFLRDAGETVYRIGAIEARPSPEVPATEIR